MLWTMVHFHDLEYDWKYMKYTKKNYNYVDTDFILYTSWNGSIKTIYLLKQWKF